jgi:hypothetical protein
LSALEDFRHLAKIPKGGFPMSTPTFWYENENDWENEKGTLRKRRLSRSQQLLFNEIKEDIVSKTNLIELARSTISLDGYANVERTLPFQILVSRFSGYLSEDELFRDEIVLLKVDFWSGYVHVRQAIEVLSEMEDARNEREAALNFHQFREKCTLPDEIDDEILAIEKVYKRLHQVLEEASTRLIRRIYYQIGAGQEKGT